MKVEGLQDRVAVVTGAARGIGAEISRSLSDQGARVAGLDLVRPTSDWLLGVECDVADQRSVDRAIAEVVEKLGPPAVLVLNAGVFGITAIEDLDLSEWKRTLDINLTGAFLCARAVLPHMRASGYGRVVAIGSSAGITGGARNVAAYAASKGGLLAFAKSIAREYAPFGITSNAVAPAFIDTEMIAGKGDFSDEIPVGRMGTPTDVASLVTYLCSQESGYVTGEVIDLNGGFFID